MPNSIDFYKSIFLLVIPVHIIVSWYDTAQTTADAITFTVPGKLSNVSSLFTYETRTDPMN